MLSTKMFPINRLLFSRKKVFTAAVNIRHFDTAKHNVIEYEKVENEKSTSLNKESDESAFQIKNDVFTYVRSSITFQNYLQGFDTEKAVHNVNLMTPSMAIEFLKYVSFKKLRSLKLLKALCAKISNSSYELSIKNCADLFYSFAHLKFKDEALLNKINEKISTKQLNEYTVHFSSSMLQSIGILKYRNCQIIEILIKNVLEQKDPKIHELLNSLHTLAIVNFKSSYVKVLLEKFKSIQAQDFSQTKSYLLYVWASVILNEISVEQISEVLSEKFGNNFLFHDDYPQNLKLQNINAAATYLIPSYTGPYLNIPFVSPQPSKSKYRFLRNVLDGLYHLFPQNGYLRTNIDTKAGFILDVECFIDLKGKPAPPTSKNVSKVGILLLDYNDFCLGKEKTVTGVCDFWQQILVAKGYKVVVIPYTEYSYNLTLLKKVEYLKAKLQNTCNT